MKPNDLADMLSDIYPVSRETFERLNVFVSGLEMWQKKTNLIAPSTLDEIWTRHIADSLQCLALKPEVRHWVDIGSGGGFPGLVIDAVMAEYTESKLDLIESNQKKAAFLRQINRQMGGNAKIHSERIESVAKQIDVPQIVTARALAALPKLLELSSPWLMNGAVGLFHKGQEFEAEVSECDGLWTFDLINHSSRIAAGSVILEISNLKPV